MQNDLTFGVGSIVWKVVKLKQVDFSLWWSCIMVDLLPMRLLLGISLRLRPREIPRNSPASPQKTHSIPPLLIGLTQSVSVKYSTYLQLRGFVHYRQSFFYYYKNVFLLFAIKVILKLGFFTAGTMRSASMWACS